MAEKHGWEVERAVGGQLVWASVRVLVRDSMLPDDSLCFLPHGSSSTVSLTWLFPLNLPEKSDA
jgi:hypothetical protein